MVKSLNGVAEKTEVIYGSDNILRSTLEIASKVRSTIDNCVDPKAPVSLVSKNLPMYRILSEAKNRGVKSRFITEITRENISYCKELMEYVELRHLDGTKGNFGIIDRIDFRASASIIEGEPPTELIVSTVRSFVKQQQYFFDMFWDKGIPAKQRIREIEHVETFREPSETQELLVNLVKSAKEEILLLFSTASAFHRGERLGLLSLLLEAASKRSVNIKILVTMDNTIQRGTETGVVTPCIMDFLTLFCLFIYRS